MAKLTNEMIEHIKQRAEKIAYGKITICFNETSQSIDIVEEERKQFKKNTERRPGMLVERGSERKG